MIDHNATRAAIAAGYSANTAESAGSRLLTNVNIAERVRTIATNRINKLEITGEKILGELAKIAFMSTNAAPDTGDLQYKGTDKIKALELLGKWHEMGLWKETLEVKKAPEERSMEFKELIGEVRVLYGSLKLNRGKDEK